MAFTESNYENSMIELFQNVLGYQYIYGSDVQRDYKNSLYEEQLLSAMKRLNTNLLREAIEKAYEKIRYIESGSLLQKNMIFTDYMQNGVPVKYDAKGKEENVIVYLIDYENAEKNEFTLVNQWTFIEYSKKRADIVVFINGLPLTVEKDSLRFAAGLI